MTEPTLDHLAEMIANLVDHIARRAKEIAEPLVTETEERCAQAISQVRQAAMATKQRADDLERELRIQLDYAVRRAERAEAADRAELESQRRPVLTIVSEWLRGRADDIEAAGKAATDA